MVREYVEDYYEPSASHANRLAADDYRGARAMSEWKRRVSETWSEVKILDVDDGGSSSGVDLGEPRNVSVSVELGSLDPNDVKVQLLHGPVSAGGEMSSSTQVDLARRAPGSYEGSFICDRSGLHGYSVRIIPTHPDLADPFELGCVTWG
jgi:starch phosphorylase